MNTFELLEYINQNDITQDVILIACLDDKIKDIQMCMQKYFEKSNKLEEKDTTNKKVIVKRIVKKIVKRL